MKKRTFVYFLLATVLFSACSTDLDVVGDYKETLVVYGLLDPSQNTQYIKINKAFLGEGSALEFAKIKDSTQFAKALSVKLIRLSDKKEFPLSDTSGISKNSGVFYGPDQDNVIYYLSTPVTISSNEITNFMYDSIYTNTVLTGSEYKLIIKNNETGIELSSQTLLVIDPVYTNPSIIGSAPTIKIIDPNNVNWNVLIRWNSGRNTRVYQTIIRFNYIDYTATGSVSKSLDWVFTRQKTIGLAGGEAMSGDFKGQDLLQFVGSQLDDYTGLMYRKAGIVEILLVAGGEDLNTFLEVNAPSTGIIQDKPEFTNITNGLGIFSSRYNKHPVRRQMDGPSIDAFACSSFTKHLKFLDRNGFLCP